MTEEGWRMLINRAVYKAHNGNSESLDLLAAHLAEIDKAKQLLRDKGYGWTGLGLLETVQTQVPIDSYYECAGCGRLIPSQKDV